MSEHVPTSVSFRDYFASLLGDAGFDVQTWQLVEDMDPVVLAENPYYVIAFQVFDLWSELIEDVGRIELNLSEIISRHTGTPKTWDTYLVLVCRDDIYEEKEFNEFSDLVFNTRYTRKIVRVGLGDSIRRLQEVARPFVSLSEARSSAKGRDPLRLLEKKMIESRPDRVDASELDKLITVFKERGNLDNV